MCKKSGLSPYLRVLGASAFIIWALVFFGISSSSTDKTVVYYGGNCTIENQGYR